MKKSVLFLNIVMIIINLSIVQGLEEDTGLGIATSAQASPSQSSQQIQDSVDRFNRGEQGSFQSTRPIRLNARDGFSGEASGTVSRSSDGIRASQASVLRTPSGTVTSASGIHASQDSISFYSANNFKNNLLQAREVSNGGWSDNTFSADSVDFISTNNPFPVSFDGADKIKFKFTGNSLSSASLTFPSKKSYYIRNPFAGNKFVEYNSFSDADNDGLSDSFEISNNLNSQSADTDNDQLSDFDEVMKWPTDAKTADTYTADSLVDDFAFSLLLKRDVYVLGDTARILQLTDAMQDSDDDYISDVNEQRYNFNPKNFDTDGDGFSDGFELVRGMNALVAEKATTLALSSACNDCVFQLLGDASSQLTIDLSGFTGDMPGSKISYTVSKVQISLGSNAPNVIGGAAILNLTINDTAKPASVTFEKTQHGYKVITINEIGQTVSRDFSEKLFGEQLEFTISSDDGVLTAVLPSPGTYRYEVAPQQGDYYGFLVDEERSFAKSFEIRRPADQKPYSLFIDKQGLRQSFDLYKQSATEDSGFVSLVEHVLQLRGVVTYARLGFRLGANTWRSGTRNFVEHQRTNDSFISVLESNYQLNVFTLLLDRTNVFAEIIGQLPLPVEKTVLYFAHFDDLGVYELAKDGSSNRFRRWEKINTPPVIRKFETNTHSAMLDVVDGIVRVIDKDVPVQSFVSSQDAQQRIFSNLMSQYHISTCDAYLKSPFNTLLQPFVDRLK